jgi:hypothetical protein
MKAEILAQIEAVLSLISRTYLVLPHKYEMHRKYHSERDSPMERANTSVISAESLHRRLR